MSRHRTAPDYHNAPRLPVMTMRDAPPDRQRIDIITQPIQTSQRELMRGTAGTTRQLDPSIVIEETPLCEIKKVLDNLEAGRKASETDASKLRLPRPSLSSAYTKPHCNRGPKQRCTCCCHVAQRVEAIEKLDKRSQCSRQDSEEELRMRHIWRQEQRPQRSYFTGLLDWCRV